MQYFKVIVFNYLCSADQFNIRSFLFSSFSFSSEFESVLFPFRILEIPNSNANLHLFCCVLKTFLINDSPREFFLEIKFYCEYLYPEC